MTLTPSGKFSNEFVLSGMDERGLAIAQSFAPGRPGPCINLTRVRATKADLLYRFGFSAVRTEAGWRYQRGKSKPMPLHHAMMCVEAMQQPEIQP